MSTKDNAEHALLSFNDVFADAFNTLLLGGRQIIRAEDLRDADARSEYPDDEGTLRHQSRDVAKYWTAGCDMRLALLGIENQSQPDPDMVLRIMSYDAAAYRAQLDADSKERHPVITIVLYFGEKPWSAPTSLLERVTVPEALVSFMNDYHIQVYDMASLDVDQLEAFRSDLGALAELLAQARGRGQPALPGRVIRHPAALAWTAGALTGDVRWLHRETLERLQGSGQDGGVHVRNILGELIDTELDNERTVLGALADKLESLGRSDELHRAIVDQVFRASLCDEFGISIPRHALDELFPEEDAA